MVESFNGVEVYCVCNFGIRNARVRETNHLHGDLHKQGKKLESVSRYT